MNFFLYLTYCQDAEKTRFVNNPIEKLIFRGNKTLKVLLLMNILM